MKIRYRDSKGHFISPQKAKRLKKVRSEIYDEKTNKKIGRTVGGYYPQMKKLAREAMPPVKIKKQKEYTRRHVAKPLRKQIVPPSEYIEELDDDEIDDLEQEWDDVWADDFSELDHMDDLDDLLSDEDEWYEG